MNFVQKKYRSQPGATGQASMTINKCKQMKCTITFDCFILQITQNETNQQTHCNGEFTIFAWQRVNAIVSTSAIDIK